jgi:hypothetical protein
MMGKIVKAYSVNSKIQIKCNIRITKKNCDNSLTVHSTEKMYFGD